MQMIVVGTLSYSCEQQLLSVFELELAWLDMSINMKKSVCMRIGPRCDVKCGTITTVNGYGLMWTDSVRYMGVYLTASRVFCCSYSHSKRSFYRSLNAIFGKIGRVSSEDVVVQLMKSKWLSSLYYGTDVCPRSQLQSFGFVISSIALGKYSTLILRT